MLRIENVDVHGWDHAIRGMRNPLESWDKSDSEWDACSDRCAKWDECHVSYKCPTIRYEDGSYFCIGKNDFDLMKRLVYAGTDHRKFMRMIIVYLDITAPLYWWKEFDTYKVGTVANSCSTMHKIHAKEFTLDDFSLEHLIDDGRSLMNETIDALNSCREIYFDFDSLYEKRALSPEITCKKDVWWQMIQLLPTSYNQRRTIMLNYEVLANIYKSRRNHKLDEWHTFCDWIETLPYSELITG